jgi:hypothetical protein
MGLSRIGRRLAVAGLVAAAGAGCSVDYIFATYSAPIAPVIVTVGCNTSFDVFENPKEGRIMVRSNVGADIAEAFCREDAALGPRPRRAVAIHFEKTNRPNCSIVEERKLSPMHWEFSYACA